jgi:hypothetical protein
MSKNPVILWIKHGYNFDNYSLSRGSCTIYRVTVMLTVIHYRQEHLDMAHT